MTENLDFSKYTIDALEAVHFKLIREKCDLDDDEIAFRPEMAHQIFGQNENIFGYEDLNMYMYYTAGPMYIYFGYDYAAKVTDIKSLAQYKMKADNIEDAINGILPEDCSEAISNYDDFCKLIDKNKDFRPFGEKLTAFETIKDNKKRQFEIYKSNINDPKFRSYYLRLQSLMFWFVDAASCIDIDDTQWTILIAYEVHKNSSNNLVYSTVGCVTVYAFFVYPEHQRYRISQMMILPPFQKLGVGTKFIESIYNMLANEPKVIDITVEDPSNDFNRIKNYVDIKLCQKLSSFAPEKLKNGFKKEMIEEAQQMVKVNKRQARFIYEILRLKNTNINNAAEYRAYRLDVKKRLNMVHYKQKTLLQKYETKGCDVKMLTALPSTEERIEVLNAEYKEVEEEYNRVLKRLAQD